MHFRSVFPVTTPVQAVFISPSDPSKRVYKPVRFWGLAGDDTIVGFVEASRKEFVPVTDFGDGFVGYLFDERGLEKHA